MEDLEYLKILITIVLALIGYIATHYFNSRRDIELKQREIITGHLINAYRILTTEITRRELTMERNLKLENIISELQLFGSEREVELTKKLAEDIKKGGDFYMDDLINELRDNLRKELNLQSAYGNVVWLRYEKNGAKTKL